MQQRGAEAVIELQDGHHPIGLAEIEILDNRRGIGLYIAMRNAYSTRVGRGAAGKHERGILLNVDVAGGRPGCCAILLQDVVEDDG